MCSHGNIWVSECLEKKAAPSVASLVKASLLFHIMDYCNCVMCRWKLWLILPRLKFYMKVLHISKKKKEKTKTNVRRHCKRTRKSTTDGAVLEAFSFFLAELVEGCNINGFSSGDGIGWNHLFPCDLHIWP